MIKINDITFGRFFNRRIISAAMTAAALIFTVPQASTYYLDATNGDDGKNGTSASNAYKTLVKVNSISMIAGDSILFKAGDSWVGQLSPKGSGSSGNPIVVGKYGDGANPRIAANGTKASAIYLLNQQYWEFNDLEVTNTASTPADLRGIWIASKDFGTLRHIHIKNCFVHDVTGDVKWISGDVADNQPGITFKTGWDASKRTGGIVFETLKPGATPVKTQFDDILVEGCRISDCSFGCIVTKQWDGTVHWGTRSSATAAWAPHTNVVIKNNYLSQLNTKLGCNTIYLTGIKKGIIEGNVCQGAGTSAIELYYADDVVIQSNETYGTVKKAGGADHNGIDPDKATTNIVIQYNYSHDNGDGILLCQFSFGSCVVRYNILQNNSRYQLYLHSDAKTTADIYNNTFYNNIYNSKIVYGYGKSLDGTYRLKNNIFVSTKTGAELTTDGGIVYDNNCYFGSSVTAPSGDAHKINADPKLVDPGKGGNGTTAGPAFTSLNGYKLQSSSPCINKGVVISNNGSKDFWAAVLYSGSPNLGAHEYGAIVQTLPRRTGSTSFATEATTKTRRIVDALGRCNSINPFGIHRSQTPGNQGASGVFFYHQAYHSGKALIITR